MVIYSTAGQNINFNEAVISIPDTNNTMSNIGESRFINISQVINLYTVSEIRYIPNLSSILCCTVILYIGKLSRGFKFRCVFANLSFYREVRPNVLTHFQMILLYFKWTDLILIFLQREMKTMAIFKKSWNLNTVKFKRITKSWLHYTLVTLQKQLHSLFKHVHWVVLS